MNWLQKIAQLKDDWWKQWKHHLENTILDVFGTNAYNQLKTTFGQYHFSINFVVPHNGHEYFSTIKVNFNEYIADQLDRKNHQVTGIEDLKSTMTGVTISILRDAGSGQGKQLGPIELLPQESKPQNIAIALKKMIIEDNDDNGRGQDPISDPTPNPTTNVPVPELV